MVGHIPLEDGILVRVQVRQRACETDLGLQTSYILQRILKMSHGLELLLNLLKIK
jgi:hypothetical protein